MKNGEIIAIYKPVGPSSHDIINMLRRLTGETRIGHAGTLDPLASGVLVVGIGRSATRQLGNIVQHDKEYIAEITLGITSTTDDEEGEKTAHKVTSLPTRTAIEKALGSFIGLINQIPPSYSAIKITGRRAYKLARRQTAPVMKPRSVQINHITLLDYNYPKIKIKIRCGHGVYIRALARDLGEKLSTGGYLSSLVRTRVGRYRLKNAQVLPSFDNHPQPPKL